LSRVAKSGFRARLDTVLPAVTCSAQSTYLTGRLPSEHGIVANGWLFRDLGDVLLWRQHNGLVEGEKVWETIRRSRPDFRVAKECWWYAVGATGTPLSRRGPPTTPMAARSPTAGHGRPRCGTSWWPSWARSRCSRSGGQVLRSRAPGGSSALPASSCRSTT